MDLDYFKRKLPCELSLPTLGGMSQFKVTNMQNIVTITTTGDQTYQVEADHVALVFNRYRSLGDARRLIAANYGMNVWTLPQHLQNRHQFSAYIAKIIDYLS